MDIKYIEKKLNIIPNGYVGSKKSKISWIHSCLQRENINLKKLRVFDAFCGAGSFSIYSKLCNVEKIISNDFLISSVLYVKTFVENPGLKLSTEEIRYLIYNKNKKSNHFMQEHYVGKDRYFHEKETIFLDNYRANIEDLDDRDSKVELQSIADLGRGLININNNGIFKIGYKKAAAFTGILSMISSWFGAGAGKFSSPSYRSREIFTISRKKAKRKDRPFVGKDLILNYLKYSKSSLDKINKCVELSDTNGLTLNTDTLSLLQNNIFTAYPIDLIYIDLPYGGDHTDYLRLYGVLESYVHNKTIPEFSYLNKINYFNSKKTYEASFMKLLELINSNKINKWVFSFNDSSWAPINRIVCILKDFGKTIKVYNSAHSYKYRKTNRIGIEYLIICK